MSNVTYFASRTAARAAATDAAKFKDFGVDAEAGKRWATVSVPSAAPTIRKAIKDTFPSSQTKKDRALTILRSLATNGDLCRKTAMEEMMTKADLTPAGASTYFANFKKGIWA